MVEWTVAGVLAATLAGCGPAHSSEGGKSTMFFGLFKSKLTTTVHPSVGTNLQAERAFPASLPTVAFAGPAVRHVALDALPPQGRLQASRGPQPPADAFVLQAAPGKPAIALVNTFGTGPRTSRVWQLSAADPTRLERPLSAVFDAEQDHWDMYATEAVIPLPGDQALVLLQYRQPLIKDVLFVYDVAADRMRRLAAVTPDTSGTAPFTYVDSLVARPDTVLVRYGTERERLGAERYVNHFNHIVLFSPRHRDGLEVVRLGLDDGNIRRWGIDGKRLWLETADDRAKPRRVFVWSLDLQAVL